MAVAGRRPLPGHEWKARYGDEWKARYGDEWKARYGDEWKARYGEWPTAPDWYRRPVTDPAEPTPP